MYQIVLKSVLYDYFFNTSISGSFMATEGKVSYNKNMDVSKFKSYKKSKLYHMWLWVHNSCSSRWWHLKFEDAKIFVCLFIFQFQCWLPLLLWMFPYIFCTFGEALNACCIKSETKSFHCNSHRSVSCLLCRKKNIASCSEKLISQFCMDFQFLYTVNSVHGIAFVM